MENIKVTLLPCINCNDVKKLIGVPWTQARFGYEVDEYEQYAEVETNDEARLWLYNAINSRRATSYAGSFVLALLENELRFVDRMRERGYTDKVLVEIHH